MRKQTKLVAVLSAAALLALGASMTSFAAGWEKDDEGIWHYYDKDGDMVTDEWKKDGGKWFYLDDEGDMLVDSWVDDEYYVGEDGAMLINEWKKTVSEDDIDDPDEDGEYWYYFGSKGKKETSTKKVAGKTYYFDTDGKMKTGWQNIDGYVYYLGGEDEGWRAENQWLWLEKSGLIDEDGLDGEKVLGCGDPDGCDDEGWYWFQSSGRMYTGDDKRKINGKYYIFNEHGQMLYEWINKDTVHRPGTYGQLDSLATSANATISQMFYYDYVEDGSRVNGWREIDGSQSVGTDNDTNWYFFDDGVAEHADWTNDYVTLDGDGVAVRRARIKAEGKYHCFDEKGKMKTGLQYIEQLHGFYYFDGSGYMQTGKVAAVECSDDDYTFFFEKRNGKNGQGITGERDGYLYYRGKRLEADDYNRLYYVNGEIYLVNTKGKIQKATNGKKFDIENKGIDAEDVYVETSREGKVEKIIIDADGDNSYDDETAITDATLKAGIVTRVTATGFVATDVTKDAEVSIPFVKLYDRVYSYDFTGVTTTTIDDVIGSDWR